MKLNEIYEELVDIAKRTGITIRRENGKFQAGYCVLNDQKIIIFNRGTTLETKSSVLARCLLSQEIDGIFLKPAVREFLDNEKSAAPADKDFNLDVDYDL